MDSRSPLAAPLALLVLSAAARAGTVLVPKDQPTIQAGVDAALDGDTILISGGTYSEAVTITSRAGLTLKAKGKVVIDAVGTSPGIAIDQCSDLELDGLRFFDGAGDALSITSSSDLVVSKCRFEDFLGKGVHAFASDHLTLDHCTFTNIADTAVALPGSSGEADCDQFTVTKCKVLDSPMNSLGMRLNGDDGVVLDNRVEANGDAVFLGGVASTGGLLQGNKISGGQVLIFAQGAQLTDNLFTDSFLSVQASSVGVSGNTCKGTTIALANTATSGVVSGNKLTVVDDGSGIQCNGCTSVQVTDNVIKGKLGDGISLVLCSTSSVDGNKVSKATLRGIVISSCNGIDVDGDVLKSCATGVEITDTCTGGQLVDCSVKGSKGDGVLIEGDAWELTANVIKGCKANGVHLGFEAGGNTLSQNVAKGSKGFDLLDESGGMNTILGDNDFGTTSP